MIAHKSGAEIARELGVSRAAISQSLKRSTEKVYKWLKKTNSSYESFQLLALMTNCYHEDDIKDLFKLLSKRSQGEIKRDVN